MSARPRTVPTELSRAMRTHPVVSGPLADVNTLAADVVAAERSGDVGAFAAAEDRLDAAVRRLVRFHRGVA